MNGVDQDILPVTAVFNSSATITGEGGLLVTYGVSAATAAFTAQSASVPGVTISSGLIVSAGNVGIGTAGPSSLFSVGPASQFQVNSSGYAFIPDGTASTPALSFSNNTNSGFYLKGSNKIGLATGGVSNFIFGNDPISGYSDIWAGAIASPSDTNYSWQTKNDGTEIWFGAPAGGYIFFTIANAQTGPLMIKGTNAGVGYTPTATIPVLFSVNGQSYFAGNVGVGTTTPGAKLDVSGVIRSTYSIAPGDGSGFQSNRYMYDDSANYRTAFSSNVYTVGYSSAAKYYGDGSGLSNIAASPVGSALANASIWVGNASNLAAAVAVTGDVTISNSGVTAIGGTKVTSAMLAGSIDDSKLNQITTGNKVATSAIANGTLGASVIASSIAVNAVQDASIVGMASSKLSGALPAISGAALTSLTAANISAGSLGASVIASSIAVNAVQDVSIVGVSGSKVGSGVPAANIAAGSLGGSVIASSIAVNAVQDASIVGMASSKLSGALPAISGAALTSLTAANISAGSLGASVIASSHAVGSVQDSAIVGIAGSKVGSGVPAVNIAAGSLGASVIASSIAVDAIMDENVDPAAAIAPSKIAGTAAILGANTFTGKQTMSGGLLVTPAALPGSPSSGDIAIDSGDNNTLKWYDGTVWRENPQRILGNSGAAGPAMTWQVLTGDSATCTTTALCAAVMTTTGVGVGTWKFIYTLIYQTANTGTGIAFALNHTGTVGKMRAMWRNVTTGGTAATGVGDSVATTNAGQLMEGKSGGTINAIIGSASAGVDTANTDILAVLEGLIVVTAMGDLQLKLGSEVAASAVKIMADSTLELNKIE